MPGYKQYVAVLAAMASLMCTSEELGAQPQSRCFSVPQDEWHAQVSGDGRAKEYMVGLDALLFPILVRFFPDGHVCGLHPYDPIIRLEGKNPSDGEVELTFLPVPPGAGDPPTNAEPMDDDEKLRRRQLKLAKRTLGSGLSARATKRLTSDLIIWEGVGTRSDGKTFDFYLKRARAPLQALRTVSNDRCGDGGCIPLMGIVIIKRNFDSALRADTARLAVSSLKSVPTDRCGEGHEVKADETCYEVKTWPFEESNVVRTLRRKSYVRVAERIGAGAGTDTESLVLQTDSLLSTNFRMNIAVAEPLFHGALVSFLGNGIVDNAPAYRANSLFWVLKAPRYKFEKNPDPSPAERTEWWKLRLQVAITEGTAGTYTLIVGLPSTRVFSWALSTAPNDDNFRVELDNDERFLDLQGRIITAITKMVPAKKALP